MTVLERYEVENKIDEQEFDHIMSGVFNTFLLHNYSYKSENQLRKKDEMLDQFGQLLETYIDLKFKISQNEKLTILNFLDKINMQRELLELKRNEIAMTDIKNASKRFGKKAQSSV